MGRLAAILAAGSVVAVAGVFIAFQQTPAGTRGPNFSGPLEETSRAQALAYARALQFDTSVSRSDGRQITWRTSRGEVQTASVLIAPELNAHRLTEAELAQGRIIARVRASQRFPKLGLPQGESSLWANRVGTRWRFVIIPDDLSQPMRSIPMLYEQHPFALPGCENSGAKLLGAGGWVWIGCGCKACCCVQAGPECTNLRFGKPFPAAGQVAEINPTPDLSWGDTAAIVPSRP